MKKIVVVFLVVIISAMAVVAFFIATFDLNRYRELIVSEIQKSTRQPVSIGSLKLSYQKGISLLASEVSLGSRQGENGLDLSIERIFLKVALRPLFQKKLDITAVEIHQPILKMNSVSGGSTEQPLQNEAYRNTADQPSFARKPMDDLLSVQDRLHISHIKITGGTLIWTLPHGSATTTVQLNSVDLMLRDFSSDRPIRFEGTAESSVGVMRKFRTSGELSLKDALIDLSLLMDDDAAIKLTSKNIFGKPFTQLQISLENMDISSLPQPQHRDSQFVSGMVSGILDIQFAGRAPSAILSSMNGKGKFRIRDGALKNQNLLRENLDRISQIPAVGGLFQLNLGPKFEAMLESPDTEFATIDTEFEIASQAVRFFETRLIHSDYQIALAGTFGFQGFVDAVGELTIEPELSAAIIKKAKELVYLANENGKISFPFVYKGPIQTAKPQPNVGSLAVQAATNAGLELLEKKLGSFLESKKEGQGS